MKKRKFTRLFPVILAVALSFALGLTAFASFSAGDISGDGKITAFDAQLLAEAKAGLRELTDEQKTAAGDLTIQDLLYHILGGTSQAVYVSENGNDDNYGTKDAPYATLDTALERVADGGTIYVTGTVAVAEQFRFPDLGKSVTISGGTLDFTALPSGRDITLKDDTRFEGVAFTFNEGQIMLACGNTLYIDENVTMNTPIKLYGGSNGTVLDGTDMTVLGGSYQTIYGGSYQTEINGDVNLTVGGNVNPDLDVADHSLSNNIYGGSLNSDINGKVNVTITGNARACLVYGGSYGGSSVPELAITGGSTVTMDSGKVMGLFGGSNLAHQLGDATVSFRGGEAEQIFGGSRKAALTGNVAVELTDGTVTRRVYGGCYNETSSTVFDSDYYVIGNVTVTIGGSTQITLDYDDADLSIYAHSRHNVLSDTENTSIVFADQTAYDTYYSKLGAQDWTMKLIMGSISAADSIVAP